ncbi:MAG: hypothetical protein JO183_05455, partial [Ktedonobacteraceae bacterium]|nr:hypothetical protein [Ktedonobacteraceae bacterium]
QESTHPKRSEGRNERRERERASAENPLLANIPANDAGEMTAMAEAFRAAARQRSSKEDTDSSEE